MNLLSFLAEYNDYRPGKELYKRNTRLIFKFVNLIGDYSKCSPNEKKRRTR